MRVEDCLYGFGDGDEGVLAAMGCMGECVHDTACWYTPKHTGALNYLLMTWYAILTVGGIVSGILVEVNKHYHTVASVQIIYTVFRQKRRRPATRHAWWKLSLFETLLVNMAVAQTLFGFVVTPTVFISSQTAEFPFGEVICKLMNFLPGVLLYAHNFALAAMAIQRFSSSVRLCAQAEGMRLSALVFIWLAAIGLSSPNLFGYGISKTAKIPFFVDTIIEQDSYEPDEDLYYQVCSLTAGPAMTVTLGAAQALFLYTIPAAITVGSSAMMCLQNNKNTRAFVTDNAEQDRRRAERYRQVNKKLTWMAASELVLWFPYVAITVTFDLAYLGSIQLPRINMEWSTVEQLTKLIMYTAVLLVNPIIHGFLNVNVQAELKDMVSHARSIQPSRAPSTERSEKVTEGLHSTVHLLVSSVGPQTHSHFVKRKSVGTTEK